MTQQIYLLDTQYYKKVGTSWICMYTFIIDVPICGTKLLVQVSGQLAFWTSVTATEAYALYLNNESC